MGFLLGLGIIIGVIFAPFMTVGAIMIHYDHTTLGIILLVLGVIDMFNKID
jgi:hypothetical protein